MLYKTLFKQSQSDAKVFFMSVQLTHTTKYYATPCSTDKQHL